MKSKKETRIYNELARKLYPHQTTSATGKRMAYVKGYEKGEHNMQVKAILAFTQWFKSQSGTEPMEHTVNKFIELME